MRGFDAVFTIGTSSVFPYIAQPVIDARRRGRMTVEINPGVSEVTHIVDYRLQTGAAAAMDALVQALDRA
jgi:NAD-dependent deacetylase